jgi:hypothetical protein
MQGLRGFVGQQGMGGPRPDKFYAPMQKATLQYLARLGHRPSRSWINLVNLAIYNWQAQGNWENVLALWLFATEKPSNVNMKSGLYPVSITGSLTHTRDKGYSGFSAANVMNFGVDLTTAFADDNFCTVFGGVVDATVTSTGLITGGTLNSTPGNIYTNGSGQTLAGIPSAPFAPTGGGAAMPAVGGGRGFQAIAPGFYSSVAGGNSGRSTAYTTTAVTPSPLARLSAYGWLSSATTAAKARRFLSTLSGLLDELSALD